jgi:hypothetical protein
MKLFDGGAAGWARTLAARWAKEFDPDAALHDTQEQREEHLAAIQAFMNDRSRWDLHGWLHQNLTILDGKAGTAFQVNAIALALLTFFVAGRGDQLTLILKIGLLIPFVFFLWSTLELSRIAFVYWSSTLDFRDPDRMLSELLRIRDQRSRVVRRSWMQASAAMVIMAVIVMVDLLV